MEFLIFLWYLNLVLETFLSKVKHSHLLILKQEDIPHIKFLQYFIQMVQILKLIHCFIELKNMTIIYLWGTFSVFNIYIFFKFSLKENWHGIHLLSYFDAWTINELEQTLPQVQMFLNNLFSVCSLLLLIWPYIGYFPQEANKDFISLFITSIHFSFSELFMASSYKWEFLRCCGFCFLNLYRSNDFVEYYISANQYIFTIQTVRVISKFVLELPTYIRFVYEHDTLPYIEIFWSDVHQNIPRPHF